MNSEIFIANFINCPYCNASLKKTPDKFAVPNFSVYSCDCDEYPVVNGVLYLTKNDTQSEKKIVELIRQKKFNKAIWKSLNHSALTHRIVFALVVILSFPLSLKFTLKLLYILGPARSWFSYLLNSNSRNTLQTALHLFKDEVSLDEKTQYILDLGCGIGQFYQKCKSNLHKNDFYIGIDKSMFSLLLAKKFIVKKNALLVCADIEHGIPISKPVITKIVFLDSLPFIYNKKKIVLELHRVLKKRGLIYFINIFNRINKTHYWGYGISYPSFAILLKEKFVDIKLFQDTLVKGKLRFINPKLMDRVTSYSVCAIKK